jgi:hypothetical protein
LVPELASNLVFVGATPRNTTPLHSARETLYSLPTDNKTNDLHIVKASKYPALTANNADPIALLKDWHQRLGHLNVQAMMRLSRAGRINGLDAITSRQDGAIQGLLCC